MNKPTSRGVGLFIFRALSQGGVDRTSAKLARLIGLIIAVISETPYLMLWFCSGHFASTWLVCLTLILRFQATAERPLTFVLFALILWPVLLELLPLRGYFALKRVTLDRLKARVHRGELKKAVRIGGPGFILQPA